MHAVPNLFILFIWTMWKGKLWFTSNKAFFRRFRLSTAWIYDSLRSYSAETAVRLVNSFNHSSSGRVEIRYSGTWGTICDHSWDIQDAEVVCRQLGFDGALSAPRDASFGQGNGPIWLDDINCVGMEISISDCRHSGWGVHNCGHHDDAGVVCRPTGMLVSLQLTGWVSP